MTALIENNKVIGVFNADVSAICEFRTGQFTYDTGNLDVIAGDDFIDGVFMRNGSPVESFVPSSDLDRHLSKVEDAALNNAEMLINMQYENDMETLGGNI